MSNIKIVFLFFRCVATLTRLRSVWRQEEQSSCSTWRTCMRACMTCSTSTISTTGGVGMLTSDCRRTESNAGCTTTSSKSHLCFDCLFCPHTSPSLHSHQINRDSREEYCLWEVPDPTHQPSGETLRPHLLCAHRMAVGCAGTLPGLDTAILQSH